MNPKKGAILPTPSKPDRWFRFRGDCLLEGAEVVKGGLAGGRDR
jgi:hypothetical protein